MKSTALHRFGKKYQIVPGPLETPCWLWTDYLNVEGYGRLRVEDRPYPAHRFSYETFVGPIAGGLEPDHLCRNRACVNYAHLELVSHQENMARSDVVGHTWTRGEKCGKSKLTEAQVLAIRADPRTQKQIAVDYGVHRSQIGVIKRKQQWKHL